MSKSPSLVFDEGRALLNRLAGPHAHRYYERDSLVTNIFTFTLLPGVTDMEQGMQVTTTGMQARMVPTQASTPSAPPPLPLSRTLRPWETKDTSTPPPQLILQTLWEG